MFFTYKFKAKKHKLSEGPHLILSNHQTTMDPFLLALSFKGPIYFMASEDLFVKGILSKIIQFLVAPIPKKKSVSDARAIKKSLRLIKEGANICIFPEGNRTYSGRQCYIDPAIAKLILFLKIPVIFYNIKGGYGTSPRWANNIRRGKMSGKVVYELSPKAIAKLSEEEVYNLVLEKLNVIEAPSKIAFKSRKRAEKLERVLYICPKCGHINTLYSKNKYVKCTECDLAAEYTEYLDFKGVKFNTVDDWYRYQEEYIKNYQFVEDDDIIFEDSDVSLYETTKEIGSTFIVNGKLTISKNNLSLSREKNIYRFKIEKIDSMTIVGKHKLNFYIGNRTYQLIGKSALNVLKYMQIFIRFKGGKYELFRL